MTDLLANRGVVSAVRGSVQGQRAEAHQPLQLAVTRAVPQVHAGVHKLGGRGLHLDDQPQPISRQTPAAPSQQPIPASLGKHWACPSCRTADQ